MLKVRFVNCCVISNNNFLYGVFFWVCKYTIASKDVRFSVHLLPLASLLNVGSAIFWLNYLLAAEHAVVWLVAALWYNPEGCGLQFPLVSLEFLVNIILSAALLHWG